jgi:hypothetical protein
MKKTDATTVEQYLTQLTPEKRQGMEQLRKLILQYLPDGYVETINWGMISYEIPLKTYPETYNGKPLSFIALAAQKNHYALYLNNVYMNPELKASLEGAFAAAGVKFDMGKSCLRVKDLDKTPLAALGKVIASTPVADFIAQYEAVKKSG